jgi:hypothetical protein
MSHFTVMVIGDNPEKQLEPFNENLDVEWIDKTQEYKDEYETKMCKEFYCDSSSSWGFEITKELFDFIKKSKAGATIIYNQERRSLSYFTRGKKYKGYYTIEDRKRCDGDAWFEVERVNKTTHPDKDVCFEGVVTIRVIDPPKEISLKEKYPDYKTYLSDWHGEDNHEKQGYYTNPKAKWDWYSLGGRWSGLIKLKEGAKGVTGKAGTFNNEVGIDQAKKTDIINFDELITFALLKDGEWFERGEVGWWGSVHNEKEEKDWDGEFIKLVNDLPPETLISIYDCHI